MNNNKQWFTLVELIVVVVILGILAVIGFVSYTDYTQGSRDANRLQQTKDIYSNLQAYGANKYLPLPDDYVTVTANWVVVWYQWYAGSDVLELIGFTSGGKDPKDNTYFTYYVSKNKKNAQILSFMEDDDTIEQDVVVSIPWISQTHAADLTNRNPKVVGSKLWILLQNSDNTPIQDVSSIVTAWSLDIVSTSGTYTAIVSDIDTVTGTWGQLISLLQIRNLWTYDPTLTAYWDMETLESTGLLADLSGNGYHGTCKNSTTTVACNSAATWPQSITWRKNSLQAMDFDGTDDNLVLPSPIDIGSDAWTVIIWFKIDSSSWTYSFITNQSGWSVANVLRVDAGQINYRHYDSTWINETGTDTMTTNQWNMVAFVNQWDDTIDFYLNGELDSQWHDSTLSIANWFVDQIGGDWGWSWNLDGKIDDMRIYNRALSAGEVGSLYVSEK